MMRFLKRKLMYCYAVIYEFLLKRKERKYKYKYNAIQDKRKRFEIKYKDLLKKYVNNLADTGRKYTLSDISVDEIADQMADASMGYGKSTVYLVGDNGATVRFQGHIYEPVWEFFEGTCDIDYLENGTYHNLFKCWSENESDYQNVKKTIGSHAEAEDYIRNHMPNGFYLKYSLN